MMHTFINIDKRCSWKSVKGGKFRPVMEKLMYVINQNVVLYIYINLLY